MVPLTRTLWQMHNYSELHFIVFTLKTANVDLVIFIPIYVNVYLINQQFETSHPGTKVLQHCINYNAKHENCF